jgi:hypothetical protein
MRLGRFFVVAIRRKTLAEEEDILGHHKSRGLSARSRDAGVLLAECVSVVFQALQARQHLR